MYLLPFPLQQTEDCIHLIPEFHHEIGCSDGCASADARHAVNQDVGFLPCLFYELKGVAEKLRDVVLLVVLSRDVQIMFDVFVGVRELSSSCDG